MAAIEFGPAGAPLDVLFLHANGFNAHTYRSILEPLSDTRRMLAIDMRGHGNTALPTETGEHRWQIYADDLRAVLAHTGMPRVLAGHSMGGATAVLALPHLQPQVRLVLFDPVLAAKHAYDDARGMRYEQPIAQGALRRKNQFASAEAAFGAYRGRGAFATWPDACLRDYLEDALRPAEAGGFELSCAPGWEAANFAAALRVSPYPALAAWQGEVEIFTAELGSVCGAEEADLPRTGRGRISMVPGSSHFLPMERWDLVRSAIAA